MRRFAIRLIIALVLSMLFLSYFDIGSDALGTEEILGYTARDIIKIESDDEFTSANGVVGGSGTEDDPYRISGWQIDASGNGYAIYISNTNAYFRIENCLIENAEFGFGTYNVGAGIYLNNVKNGIISGVTSRNNDRYGVYVKNSENVKVLESTITSNPYGIYSIDSSNIEISENDIEGEQSQGIYLNDNDNAYVANNTIRNASNYGIELNSVKYSHLYGNEMINTSTGIYVERSIYTNKIEESDISQGDTGIKLYLTRNAEIRGGNIESNNNYGIYISSSSYNTIHGVSLQQNMYGIYLKTASSNEIRWNNVSKAYEAIHVEDSNNNKVSNNTCVGDGTAFTRDGIYLTNSDGAVIRDNHCSRLRYGVDVYHSDSAEIINNEITGNVRGIALSFSNYSTARYNYIGSNDWGIDMQYSDNATISHNRIESTENYGIQILSKNSVISWNDIDTAGNGGIYSDFYSVNVSIENNPVAHTNIGIEVYKSVDMHILGNKVEYTKVGIQVNSSVSQNSKILRNSLWNISDYGVELQSSSHVRVEREEFHNTSTGVYVKDSQHINVANFSFSGGYTAIHLISSQASIYGVISENNTKGIMLNGANNTSISHVTASYNDEEGIRFYGSVSKNIRISNSTITHNGKDGMYIYAINLEIQNVNCSFNNYAGMYLWLSGNVVIKNSTIIHNDYEGLVIQGAYDYRFSFPIKVMNSNISNNGDTGIYGAFTSYVTISNNTILNNTGWGVYYDGDVAYSYNWTVENNTVSKNHGGGINVGGTYPTGPGGQIQRIVNNTVMENDGEGIYVHYDNAYISGNTIARNSGSGIYTYQIYAVIVENKILENGGNGIDIRYSYRVNITGNEISRNSGDGICIFDLPGNSKNYIGITKNLIVNNTGYGVNISHWERGTIEIYLNSFYYNHGSGDEYDSSHIQARDNSSGVEVRWYSALGKGNYWADWTEPDRNDDGIVDDPYILDGHGEDPYPIVDPEVPIPELSFFLIPILAIFVLFALRRRF